MLKFDSFRSWNPLLMPPPSQTTPAAQAEPAVQAKPVPTPTNAEALPPRPSDKTKVSEIVANCGNNRK